MRCHHHSASPSASSLAADPLRRAVAADTAALEKAAICSPFPPPSPSPTSPCSSLLPGGRRRIRARSGWIWCPPPRIFDLRMLRCLHARSVVLSQFWPMRQLGACCARALCWQRRWPGGTYAHTRWVAARPTVPRTTGAEPPMRACLEVELTSPVPTAYGMPGPRWLGQGPLCALLRCGGADGCPRRHHACLSGSSKRDCAMDLQHAQRCLSSSRGSLLLSTASGVTTLFNA